MKIVALSGSRVGSKTRTALDYTLKTINDKFPNVGVTMIDLAEYEVQFSDGRNYLDYDGNTGFVSQQPMTEVTGL